MLGSQKSVRKGKKSGRLRQLPKLILGRIYVSVAFKDVNLCFPSHR